MWLMSCSGVVAAVVDLISKSGESSEWKWTPCENQRVQKHDKINIQSNCGGI